MKNGASGSCTLTGLLDPRTQPWLNSRSDSDGQ
jgi:hypothetical protein